MPDPRLNPQGSQYIGDDAVVATAAPGDLIETYNGNVRSGVSVQNLRKRPVKVVTADTTLTAADNGALIIVNAAATKVITLPATVAGLRFTITHQVATTGGAGHSLSPAAADLIRGDGITPADNKDLICTQATSRIGDSVTVVGDGVDGWYIESVTGAWARE